MGGMLAQARRGAPTRRTGRNKQRDGCGKSARFEAARSGTGWLARASTKPLWGVAWALISDDSW
jgi:hypothetical protein